MYSINTSRFFGKSEMIIELEEHEANQQFEELLRLDGAWEEDEEIWNDPYPIYTLFQ